MPREDRSASRGSSLAQVPEPWAQVLERLFEPLHTRTLHAVQHLDDEVALHLQQSNDGGPPWLYLSAVSPLDADGARALAAGLLEGAKQLDQLAAETGEPHDVD
jgi:hypothetical protein